MSTPSFINEEYIVAGEKKHQGICATDFLSTNNAVSFISIFFSFHWTYIPTSTFLSFFHK